MDLLDLVPRWFRFRWPLRRYYWQPEDLAEAKRRADELGRRLGWVDNTAESEEGNG